MFEEHLGGGEAESFEHPGAEWVDQDVRCGEEGEQDPTRVSIAKVEGDGGLMAGELVC